METIRTIEMTLDRFQRITSTELIFQTSFVVDASLRTVEFNPRMFLQSFGAAKHYILLLLFISIILCLTLRHVHGVHPTLYNILWPFSCTVCFRCRLVCRFQTINNCSSQAHDLRVSYFLGLGSTSLIEYVSIDKTNTIIIVLMMYEFWRITCSYTILPIQMTGRCVNIYG